jgi:primosomal protein N' (replication factor Y)
MYADVILPLAIPKPYTYAVPESLQAELQFGIRVEVPFGKGKVYSGIVARLHHDSPGTHQAREILSVLDTEPLIFPLQLKFWLWMANYYCCNLGEVMSASLPAHLKLSSETRLVLNPDWEESGMSELSDREYMIMEALSLQEEITLEDVRGILGIKTVLPIINSLLAQSAIVLHESLQERYKPRTVTCVRLLEPYRSNPKLLTEAFSLLERSSRQTEALMAFLQLERAQPIVARKEICQKASVDTSVIQAVAKKEIWEVYERNSSRLEEFDEETSEMFPLSAEQVRALREIRALHEKNQVVLLHGVTGCGKTRVYMELIQECIQQGGQVLYLLPEIGLSTQVVGRLQRVFGDQVVVYHSRINDHARVELWKEVAHGKPILLGARSGLFMPFRNLQLVIVDEEHDGSYKQQDPAPRYQGRDSAVALAALHGAQVVLGTATPSVETYHNVQIGKYGLVEMNQRFGGVAMPEMLIADVRQERKDRRMQAHFTGLLLDSMRQTLDAGEQVILFQNRRGYAPSLRCNACGWRQECVHCDVSLTYHQHRNHLRCHYCGYQTALPKACPACGSMEIELQGFGTEKIEDELAIYFPEARIARMDADTMRGKTAMAKLLQEFDDRELDILVGTQMVTKGLDFHHVGLVGILSSDQLLQYPDFRSAERAFQLMLQVAGRGGRREKQGRVIIQAINTAHPVLADVLDNNFSRFFQRELVERKSFEYPPFRRLILVTLKHRQAEVLHRAADLLANELRGTLRDRILGPTAPPVGRVRGFYLQQILLKVERDAKLLQRTKELLWQAQASVHHTKGLSGVRIAVDVDPG